MARTFILIAAVLGFTGVALGAFGAHALQARLEANDRVDTFQTANRYHLIHTLAILGIGILLSLSSGMLDSSLLQWAGYSFTIGTLVFSGSLYILAIFNIRIMGAVAPLGGLALLGGWLLLGLASWRASP